MNSEAEIAEIWRLFRETRDHLDRMARLQDERQARTEAQFARTAELNVIDANPGCRHFG